MYLNRSISFGIAYHSYTKKVGEYFEKLENNSRENWKNDYQEYFNKNTKIDFINEIEKRYLELSNELTDIESELNKKKTKA